MPTATLEQLRSREQQICVLGLGYVGLPLAAAFSKHFKVVGFDINRRRVEELSAGRDATRELSAEQLSAASVRFTTDPSCLAESAIIIVTVPTPVDDYKQPDLTPLRKSSETIGKFLKPGTIVVYESTVYPGVTEDECVPVLEKTSGLKWGRDFFVGYSPERVNPGDKERTVEKIKKVVAGDSPATAALLNAVYGQMVTAGTHLAPSIKAAEAAKVIENTQRDVNIALMNEFALIFDRVGINTLDVLAAAGTKWNFLPFRPGLVGGHCIGVDPYYLTWKAQSLGYEPDVILSGRRINDSMGGVIAEKAVKLMIKSGARIKGARALLLGFTFKENVPDIRNTRIIDVKKALEDFDVSVEVCDPQAYDEEVHHEYGFHLTPQPGTDYDVVILAVKHTSYASLTLDQLKQFSGSKPCVVVDIKGFFTPEQFQAAGVAYWQL